MSGWLNKLLVRRLVAGDNQAWTQLVHTHHAALFGLLAGLCGDTQLAQDLTQETFAAAWSGIASFRADCSLRTWLHRIAYRKCVSDARQRLAQSARLQRVQTQGADVDERPRCLDRLIENEESRRLWQAVDVLGDGPRALIVMHYVQGLSFRQMAGVLEEPAGTVKWRTHQALEELRTALGHEATAPDNTSAAESGATPAPARP